ncbi:unnamed protein product, partial [Staurois parvus]
FLLHPCTPPSPGFNHFKSRHSPPFQSGHFHPLPVQANLHLSAPSSPDTFPPPSCPGPSFSPFQSGHFPPPSSPDTLPPFQSGHFPPLPVRTLSPPLPVRTLPPLPVRTLSPLPVRTLSPPSSP